MKNNREPLSMEVTILSAQGLKTTSTFFSHRLRPFITLKTVPPPTTNSDKHSHVYQTRVCDEEGINPTWGDKFYLPLDPTFFAHSHGPYSSSSSIYLQIYTKRLLAGKSQLGWCQIPASDILDGFAPVGSVRHLSYRLRDKDGSRSHGVVNVAVRLQGQVPVCNTQGAIMTTHSPEMGVDQTVVGIPVTMFASHV